MSRKCGELYNCRLGANGQCNGLTAVDEPCRIKQIMPEHERQKCDTLSAIMRGAVIGYIERGVQ